MGLAAGKPHPDARCLGYLINIGGSKGIVNNKARQPNSFVYRLVPSNPHDKGWRVFWTQQHGDNTTFEIVRPAVAATTGRTAGTSW